MGGGLILLSVVKLEVRLSTISFLLRVADLGRVGGSRLNLLCEVILGVESIPVNACTAGAELDNEQVRLLTLIELRIGSVAVLLTAGQEVMSSVSVFRGVSAAFV